MLVLVPPVAGLAGGLLVALIVICAQRDTPARDLPGLQLAFGFFRRRIGVFVIIVDGLMTYKLH